MSHQQGQEPSTPRTNSLVPQGASNEQMRRYKKSNPNNANGVVTYSRNYQSLMRLGRKRTLAAAGAGDYLAGNLHSTISKGSSSVTRLSNRPGDRRHSLRTAVQQWLSDTSAMAMTQGVDAPAPTPDEASSPLVVGVSSQASNVFSHISATPTPPGLVGSQAIDGSVSSISGSSIHLASRSSTPVPGSFSVMTAASLASEAISSQTSSRSVSTISEPSSQPEFETQISGTNSLTSVDSRPHNSRATSAAPTPSRRVPAELRFDIQGPGRRNTRSTRDGDIGPRLTATEIQKLLVIPEVLVTQKDYGKSNASARIVPPRPLKKQHHNGEQVKDAKPKLTVTELQKKFVIPDGLVTQKQCGKKAPGRSTNSFAKGSYAGRLVEIMHSHRSEYSIWANATIRERTCSSFSIFASPSCVLKNIIYLLSFHLLFCIGKLLGSTEPVAVIEVMSISRNMRLQWAKCKVVFRNKTKPLFGLTSIRTQSVIDDCESLNNSSRIKSMSLGDTEASGLRSDWTATWSGRSGSLYDELLNVNNRSASFSRSGSGDSEGVPIKDKDSGKEWRVLHELQSRGSGQVRSLGTLLYLSKNIQCSEGDDISNEQGQELSLCTTPAARSGLLSHADMLADASRFNGLSGSGDAPLAKSRDYQDVEIDVIKNNGTMEVEVVKALDRTVSVISSIDGGSSDSGELPALVPLNPLRNTGNQQKETTISLQMTTEPGPTFDIIFSNLFNHSTLKVADRVEIHEPCRPVALFGSDPTDCIWIVERYVVWWQKISL
ncbi:hypothetical protein BKA57DRAFT_463750 [Linnemannia elongata]|nr:hypothetical protein BKA57DRAFT_463750 [Linnemannia elongata]